MIRRPGRRLPIVGVAVAAALAGLVAPPLAAPAVAASDLTILADAVYEVAPDDHVVRVRVDLVARNHLRDTATRRYYFDRAFLAVPPGATAIRISSPTGRPTVRVTRNRADHQLLAIAFGQRIAAGKAARLTLTFELPDVGDAARTSTAVRVGQAFASFPVWAFGYPNGVAGSSVRVIVPAGYEVRLAAGDLPAPTTDAGGRTVFDTGPLPDATAFSAWFVAERPVAPLEKRLQPSVNGRPAAINLRAWPDDAAWAGRVGGLVERALPELGGLIGLAWPYASPLAIEESVGPEGGHAGAFDPAAGRIEVAWHADSFVVLHEAAHAWFNGRLLADRWANEAFASYYAVAVAGRIDEAVVRPELAEGLLRGRIPLNAWSPSDATDPARRAGEGYAYAASFALATQIAERAGLDGLREVWGAAAAGNEPVDWRRLLDLLEARTGQKYDDLWRAWVVRDADVALLDARQAARERYDAVVRAAGPWQLPAAVTDALAAWQFDRAATLMDEADAILARREELRAAAGAAGLRLPARLETVFESDAGFAAATAEADAEAATIDAIAAAEAARPRSTDPLQQVGLFGADPAADLAAAREAFAVGDLAAAADGASDAYVAWSGAGDTGRGRLLASIGAAILALLALVVGWPRARAWLDERRDRSTDAAAEPPAPA
ncbi:MAG TPA: hypothetical protein VH723_10500 [Candidatus Limnocylindrales bacterium]